MRNITLVKQYPSLQLGHLYEHLYMRRINEFFYDNHLYKNLDYFAHGATYDDNCYIVIEIDLYTESAISFEKELLDLHIQLGEHNSNVSNEFMRMTAEEPFKLYIDDAEAVLEELNELDNLPWIHIDNLDMLDRPAIRKHTNDSIYLTNTPQSTPFTLHCSVVLDYDFAKDNRQLAPLFNVVGRIFMLTAEMKCAADFGMFGGSLGGKPQPLSVTGEFMFARAVARQIELSLILKRCRQVFSHVFSDDTIARLATTLSELSYQDDTYNAQNIERIINESGVLIGSLGWRNISTPENIRAILEHTSIHLRLGRQKTSVPLV